MTLPQRLVVTDLKAAAFLLDGDLLVLLKPFIKGACTVGDAAEQLGMKPTDLYYRVKRMLELGLLRVSHEESRRGRPLKYYRSSADEFFIPFCITSLEGVEDFIVKHDEPWSRRLVRSLAHAYTHEASLEHWGLHISYREDGFLMFDLASHPPQQNGAAVRGAFSNWDSSFYLGEEDRRRMADEVHEVLERYRSKRSGPRCVLRFAVAPWEVP